MDNTRKLIIKCTHIIEEKLHWSSSKEWQNQDFIKLSEQIFEELGILLSSSTLKRIWGKVPYHNSPNLNTLNALAQFAGFQDWNDFVVQETTQAKQESKPKQSLLKSTQSIWKWLGILTLILISVALLFQFIPITQKVIAFQDIQFSSRVTSQGVPNTVIFDYDVQNSNADSVFIQQSWDEDLRFQVAKEQQQYAATYYYPGYYRAKLLLNDSIVKEHDLFIECPDWLATLEKYPIPIYFKKEEIQQADYLEVSPKQLKGNVSSLEDQIPWTSFFKVDSATILPSDAFDLEVKLRHNFPEGDAICQKSTVTLLCTDGIHLIPLSIKGCVGELELVLANERIKGQTNDLSSFGVNFEDWVSLKCTAQNGQIKIWIEDQVAYEGPLKESIGKIIGVRVSFLGSGALRDFKLSRVE